MTEEEKEAIETLQYLCSDDCINKDIIKTIVKLIEKLKKENEELKNTNSSADSSAEILGEVLRKFSSKLITMKFELDKQSTKIFKIYHEQINKREWWKDEKFLEELLEEEE